MRAHPAFARLLPQHPAASWPRATRRQSTTTRNRRSALHHSTVVLGSILVALASIEVDSATAATYVGRAASATFASSSTSATVATTRSVAAGDALIVAVLLSSTSTTGAVQVTDSAGNLYTLDREQNDGSGGDRMLVFSTMSALALPAGGTIRATYPSAAECHLSADEFAGLVAPDKASSQWGTTSSFTSGPTATTSQPSEFLFAAVGNESGGAATWSSAWTGLTALAISTDRLAAAYQAVGSTGAFAATGSITGVWMAAIVTYGAGPPPENPPVARLTLTKPASPPLTVTADASASTDVDSTGIATYQFDFGDGTPPDTTAPPRAAATHTYATAGTYTVTLIVTDTAPSSSAPATATVTVSLAPPPPDNPPVAKLTVTKSSTVPLTITADASASTDTDLTPIALYRFDFGDGKVDTTAAPVATRTHAYAAGGSYTVRLNAIDTGGKTSSTVSTSVSMTAPPDNAPVARLSVSKESPTSFTVTADGSTSTDTDLTPIANYRFDFGDGAVVTTIAPTAGAPHTYTTWGTYTVKLKVTDTAGKGSSTVSTSVTVTGPDDPPVARLTVTQASIPLTTVADGATSTDADATPIKTYRFDFGDGTSAVSKSAPTSTAQHTYAAAGTYTIELIVTDTGGLVSLPVSAAVTETLAVVTPGAIAVYAGYYDTHHPAAKAKPNPWMGSPGVVFVGKSDNSSGGWDTSCLRIDNLGSSTLAGVSVSVDIGSKRYALWGTNSIPPGAHLILAQTSMENFDGSDTNPAGCVGCSASQCVTNISHTIPVAHVTIAGTTTDYYDLSQVLNTHGADAAGCPYTGHRNDESEDWKPITPRTSTNLTAHDGSTEAGPTLSLPYTTDGVSLALPYPNPTTGELSFRFRTMTRGPVRLGVYDIAGRLVRSYLDDVIDPGDYLAHVDIGGAPAGIYFCTLWTPEQQRRREFVVTH